MKKEHIQKKIVYLVHKTALSHHSTVFFSQNKLAISKQTIVLFSPNKSASATRYQPNETGCEALRN
jgi:hypothetical protein